MNEVSRTLNTKDEWLTPPKIVESLGEFDLDPCSPINRPWNTAKNHYTILDNGLIKEWFGRVWMNPPYGKELILWLNKIALHGNGIALTFARTDTDAFQNYVFPFADSILFINKRLTFYNVDGTPGKSNGGAPSVLIGYGENNSEILSDCGIRGRHLPLNSFGISVIGFDASWRVIIKTVFIKLNKPATLNEIYNKVQEVAPDKVKNNKHFQAKVRQTVQKHFNRLSRGVYKL